MAIGVGSLLGPSPLAEGLSTASNLRYATSESNGAITPLIT